MNACVCFCCYFAALVSVYVCNCMRIMSGGKIAFDLVAFEYYLLIISNIGTPVVSIIHSIFAAIRARSLYWHIYVQICFFACSLIVYERLSEEKKKCEREIARNNNGQGSRVLYEHNIEFSVVEAHRRRAIDANEKFKLWRSHTLTFTIEMCTCSQKKTCFKSSFVVCVCVCRTCIQCISIFFCPAVSPLTLIPVELMYGTFLSIIKERNFHNSKCLRGIHRRSPLHLHRHIIKRAGTACVYAIRQNAYYKINVKGKSVHIWVPANG